VPGSLAEGESTTQPPVSFAAVDPSAVEVFEGLSSLLPMTADEKACAAAKLAADPDLLARVKPGVVPGTADFERLASFGARCRREVTNARATARAINDGHGGTLSAEQVTCLERAYAALSDVDLDSMTEAGVNPSGSLAARGVQVMSGMLSSCGVSE
jgi:hypothetical protein